MEGLVRGEPVLRDFSRRSCPAGAHQGVVPGDDGRLPIDVAPNDGLPRHQRIDLDSRICQLPERFYGHLDHPEAELRL